MNKTLIIVAVVILLGVGGFLLLGSRGSNRPTTTTPSETTNPTKTTTGEATDSVAIETKNFAFSPTTIKIKAAGTITYTNGDSVAHSFTADDGESFDSGLVGRDRSTTITAPSVPGTYTFHCTPHPSMKGTLIVE